MTIQARCHDTLRDDRCTRELGHDGAHRNRVHVWQTRDVPVPAWRSKATFARDLTGRVA